MPKAPNKFTTLAAYARHRGVSRPSVTQAVQEGRLRECIVWRAGRPAISDVELADREWAANTKSSARTMGNVSDAGVPPLAVSRARLEAARAGIAMLEFGERKGKLVAVEGVRAAVATKFSEVRVKLLGLASKVRQRLPHLQPAEVRTIDDLVREALTALADGDAVPETGADLEEDHGDPAVADDAVPTLPT